MDLECDILVIGAGPGGSGAAMAAASAGADVLMIDRKKEIGTPVQCGEVIGASLAEMIDVPPEAIVSCQDRTRFLIGREIMVENSNPYWRSVTVERKMLDKLLAHRAAMAGARIQADTRLIGLDVEGDQVVSALLRHRGSEVRITPKALIAADGVHSTVGRELGLETFDRKMIAYGAEFEMSSREPLPTAMQIHLEEEVGLGYGWVIPKGRHRANVGLATVGEPSNRRERLEAWIEGNPLVSRYFDGGAVLEVKSGEAPVPGFEGGPVHGNVMFVGDSAGQTLAFVGEGIAPSHLCGRVAGTVMAAALSSNNLGALEAYGPELESLMGEEFALGTQLKDAIIGIWGMDFIPMRERIMTCGLLMCECMPPELLDDPPDSMDELMEAVMENVASNEDLSLEFLSE